jgi:hypothetical protein
LPDFNNLTPVKSGNVTNFDLSVRNQSDNFAFNYSGYIHVPADGEYTFYTSSDDGSKLFIGTTQVVNNDGLHAKVERSGKIGLKAGKHSFRVTFFERTQGDVLEVRYQGPAITKQQIPSTALFRTSTINTLSGTHKVTAKHSGKAMAVSNGSTTDGANVHQWTSNETAAQLWIVEPLPEGYYQITNKASGKALQVQNSSLSNGGNIQQGSYQGTANQQWKIEPVGNGYYKIVSRLSSKVIDVSGVSKSDGANIQQWSYTGGDNQQWKFENLPSARIASDEYQETELRLHPNPASNIITISMASTEEQEAEMIVCDLFSKTLLSKKVLLNREENLIELNIGSLKNGIYLVRIVSDTKSVTRKVMVNR